MTGRCDVCGGPIAATNKLGVCRKTPECDRARNERMRRQRGIQPRDQPRTRLEPFVEVEGERWRPVVGYPNYAVSDLGRVHSLPRRYVPGGILTPWPDEDGWLHVTIYRDGRGKKPYVHRLVAEAFIGPCPPGMETCHGPNGKLDNRAVHLYYDTHARNVGPDKHRDGSFLTGEAHQNAVLTMTIVSESRRRYAERESVKALAAEFGVNWRTLDQAIQGRTWQECPVPPSAGRQRGASHRDAKLSDAIILECRARNLAGEDLQALAREFGVSRPALYAAVIGRTWKHIAPDETYVYPRKPSRYGQ